MNKQSGFSLVEIMIALLIGLFLLGGILQMFSASQQTYRMQSNLARLQENGRFALDFLARDIRMASYWGCMTSSTADISGTEGAVNVPDSISIQAAFVLIPTGICGNPVNSANSCGAVNCYTDLTSSITYIISTPAITVTSPNPNITLYRNTNNVSNPLIEGIQNMQILYGVDSDSDGAANYYVSANNVANMLQVVSVRISLLVVTLDDYLTTQPMTYTYNGITTTPTDHKIRRVFNTSIAIRNHLL
jgi:type IV pilus assembly protein PilW